MSELLTRKFSAELSVRADGEGRTVSGLCCPFNSPTDIHEWGVNYREQFAPGAFIRSIARGTERVKFLAQHDRMSFPLGRATMLVDDEAKYPGLYGEFRVSRTERGDEALELIHDGALDGLSIGFTPVRSNIENPRNGDDVTRYEARLAEVSAVNFPAYDDARISGVRAEDADYLMALFERFRQDAPKDFDLTKVDAWMGMAYMARAGKMLSAATSAQLQNVLDHVAAADRHVDAAQPLLADLMGVPNPDDADTAPDADADDTQTGEGGDDTGGRSADDTTTPEGDAETRETPTDDSTPVTGMPHDLAARIARRHRIAV